MPYEIAISKAMVVADKGSIAVGSGAVGIPAASLDKAKGGEIEVLLGVETDQIRLSLDATAAGATDMLFDVGDKIRISGPKTCRDLTMIQVTTAATVRYVVFGKAI